MRRSILCLALVCGFWSLGCDDGGGGNVVGLSNGGNSMTATVAGAAWSSDPALITLTGSATPTPRGTITISGTRTTGKATISLTLILSYVQGAYTYPLGVDTETTPGGTGQVILGSDVWMTPLSGAAGTVVISKRTDTQIVGTFSFDAEAVAGAMPATQTVTGGAFDITVAAGLPPLPTLLGSTARATIDGKEWKAATTVAASTGPDGFVLTAGNTEYALTLAPKVLVGTGNTYGIPSQMSLSVTRVGTTESWSAVTGPDVGSVTIGVFNANRLSATLQATIPPLAVATMDLTLGGGQLLADLIRADTGQ
jgi:hypothetical protein